MKLSKAIYKLSNLHNVKNYLYNQFNGNCNVTISTKTDIK